MVHLYHDDSATVKEKDQGVEPHLNPVLASSC